MAWTIELLPFSWAVRRLVEMTIPSVDRQYQKSINIPIVVSILSDIPHPGQCLIPALLYDLQVTYLYARHREIRNLKLNRERWSCWLFVVCETMMEICQPEIEMGVDG